MVRMALGRLAQGVDLRFTTYGSIPMAITIRKPHSFAVPHPRHSPAICCGSGWPAQSKVLRTAIFISPLDLPTSKSIREIAFNPARLYDSGRSKFDP